MSPTLGFGSCQASTHSVLTIQPGSMRDFHPPFHFDCPQGTAIWGLALTTATKAIRLLSTYGLPHVQHAMLPISCDFPGLYSLNPFLLAFARRAPPR